MCYPVLRGAQWQIRLVQMNVVHRVKPQWPSVEQYVGDAEVLGAVYQQSGTYDIVSQRGHSEVCLDEGRLS